jgi:hypothetical protein
VLPKYHGEATVVQNPGGCDQKRKLLTRTTTNTYFPPVRIPSAHDFREEVEAGAQ